MCRLQPQRQLRGSDDNRRHQDHQHQRCIPVLALGNGPLEGGVATALQGQCFTGRDLGGAVHEVMPVGFAFAPGDAGLKGEAVLCAADSEADADTGAAVFVGAVLLIGAFGGEEADFVFGIECEVLAGVDLGALQENVALRCAAALGREGDVATRREAGASLTPLLSRYLLISGSTIKRGSEIFPFFHCRF